MSDSRSSGPSAKRIRVGERTMLACIHCKSKKLKCDGQTPQCQNCARSGRQCLVEDPATGLCRPRDYLKSLEARVAYLESLLQQARPEVALDHFEGPQQGGQVNAQSAVDATSPEVINEENVDDLSTDVALLCLSAAGREPHYFGPSCAVSFSKIVSAAMGLHRRTGSSQRSASEAHAPEVHRTVSVPFPSQSLASKLSQAYFKNIHPQYPFLHKPTIIAWEEACETAHGTGNLEGAGELALFFVLMIYAMGSLALGPAHRDSAEAYYARALEHQSSILELDGLESIQSILCCAVYSIKSPVGISLWKISGMAIRHCIELGYHRSVAKYRKHLDPLTAEISRRCFWVAYDIDRVAAFILGRPVGIPDNSIDVELPTDLDDEYITREGFLKPQRSETDPPTHVTGAIHVIKLRRLWSKFADNLYPTTTRTGFAQTASSQLLAGSLRQELEDWHASIPEPIDSSTNPLSVFASKAWFQLAYDHSILLLYRHYITLPPQPGEEDSVESAFEECVARSREICLVYRRLYQSPTIQFTWGSLHILFVSGLTYLYCLWKSLRVRNASRPSDVINTCMACNTVLVIIAERWSQATAYRDTFETLSQKTINMICTDLSSTANGNAVTAANLDGAGFAPDQQTFSHDWFGGLEGMDVPHESEWFVEELLLGMRNFQPADLAYEDLPAFHSV
ncbi:hypothetical protein DM02DRAFT_595836 [Periconia macrospinosa]|uniref:Zn(2)-C6 fungal-type domain-containing protein n=1 Tax=Periconia macrospinosa TaxID=97972 RepID=A0A2V1DKC7_9PLEO|nr:hypothetical protein DM02DRAFT_595836 [Periconia macrospinosa]